MSDTLDFEEAPLAKTTPRTAMAQEVAHETLVKTVQIRRKIEDLEKAIASIAKADGDRYAVLSERIQDLRADVGSPGSEGRGPTGLYASTDALARGGELTRQGLVDVSNRLFQLDALVRAGLEQLSKGAQEAYQRDSLHGTALEEAKANAASLEAKAAVLESELAEERARRDSMRVKHESKFAALEKAVGRGAVGLGALELLTRILANQSILDIVLHAIGVK